MKISKIYHGFIFILQVCIFFLSFPLAYIIYGKYKYWLISEVDFDARDNGFAFFEYLNKEHNEINSIYLISKNNPKYVDVKNIGNTLEPYSFKHWLIFIASKYKISTLVHGCSPSGYITVLLHKFHGPGKNIALKHGIFKNLHPNYFKKNAHLDMICCGAQPEYEFIKKEFGYDENVAQYTGLARFDKLHNFKVEKEIFIMPTWRRWLDSITDIDDFRASNYYKNWFSFLNNKKINEICFLYGYKICFYVHPKLNKFLSAFQTNTNIEFLNSKNGDSVQDHLKSCSLFVTDFSSTFFDVAYMKKPSIYFQFDENEYYGQHYKKAYFDYRENGFGPVTISSIETINCLENIIKNNCQFSDIYLKRSIAFFELNDNLNCERIYESIIKLFKSGNRVLSHGKRY